MTATDANPTTCPNCSGVYSFRQEDGKMFCPECRTEWVPGQARPVAEVSGGAQEVAAPVLDVRDIAGQGDVHSTVLNVTYRDLVAGIERVDRYTHLTHGPHTEEEAARAAIDHFERPGETEWMRSTVVMVDPPASFDPVTAMAEAEAALAIAEIEAAETAAEEADADFVEELKDLTLMAEGEAALYLERLAGTGVDLEGGQRGVLLGFPDDDHAEVQLRDGSVVTVEFNDIIRADNATTEDQVLALDLDDDTAAMFGAAALTMACLVIEAGLRSIEGEGAEAHLVEPPSGWIPDDGNILPLMEQSAAAAVALLIQTFALPRELIAEAVETVRANINPILNPEDVTDAE